jgi:hypothetical protein
MTDTAASQLHDELASLAHGLAAILGTDILPTLEDRIRDRAETLIADLDAGEHPDALAVDILAVLHPAGPPLDWWQTPLGVAIAPAMIANLTDDDGWSQGEAATVLGVSRGTVSQLVHRGTIEQTPDGSCSQASVLLRLVRLAKHAQ